MGKLSKLSSLDQSSNRRSEIQVRGKNHATRHRTARNSKSCGRFIAGTAFVDTSLDWYKSSSNTNEAAIQTDALEEGPTTKEFETSNLDDDVQIIQEFATGASFDHFILATEARGNR